MNIKKIAALFLAVVILPVPGVSKVKAANTFDSDFSVEIRNSKDGKNSFTKKDGKLTVDIGSDGMPATFTGVNKNNDMTTDVAVISLDILLKNMKSPSAVLKLELEGEESKTELYISNGHLKIGNTKYRLKDKTETSIKLLLDKSKNTYSLIIGKSVAVRDKAADFEVTADIKKVKGYAYSSKEGIYSEAVISKLEISPDKEAFRTSQRSYDDGSAYIARDTYDDYPANRNLIYTGYAWYEGTLTSAQAAVIKENDSNQVLRLRTIARTNVDASESNSAILYGYTQFKDEKNVISTDIFLHDKSSKIRFRLRQTPTATAYGFAHIQDGILYADGIPVMQLDVKKWHNISFVIDSKDNYFSFDVYADGKEISKGHTTPMSKAKLLAKTSVFELYMTSPANTGSTVYLDNYNIYQGEELLEDEYFLKNEPDAFFVERETGAMTKKLEDALILAEGAPDVKLFSQNSEIDKNNRDVVPYKSGDIMMVPMEYVAKAYGFEVSEVTGGISLKADAKSVTIANGYIRKNGTQKALSNSLVKKNGVKFIAAEDIAYAVDKKLQVTDTGLIIISDSEKFYDETQNSYEIVILSRLLKNSNGGPRLLSEVDDEFFNLMRNKVNSNLEPYKTAWEKTKANADKALKTTYPMLLFGYTDTYYDTALKAGGAVRDLAFVYRVTKDEKYAQRAKEILEEWARAENPFPKMQQFTGSEAWTKINGLVMSRATTAFLYGYSYLYPYLDSELCRDVELWAGRVAAGLKIYLWHWLDNDCFGKQYWQNHIAIDIMGITAAGIISKDLDLLWYVIGDSSNPRKITDLINGCILMKGDELCPNDPTLKKGAPAAQSGEIYDRYRMNTNRGIQYAELTLRALTYTTEMLYQYGYDYYNYVGKNGENIRLPFEFYGDFYVTGDSTIKGGYYKGCIIIERYHSMYPIANARYPKSESIKNTCLNVKSMAVSDEEQMGYLAALTHGVITK